MNKIHPSFFTTQDSESKLNSESTLTNVEKIRL